MQEEKPHVYFVSAIFFCFVFLEHNAAVHSFEIATELARALTRALARALAERLACPSVITLTSATPHTWAMKLRSWALTSSRIWVPAGVLCRC